MSGRRVSHDIPHVSMCEYVGGYSKEQLRSIVEHARSNALGEQLRDASSGWTAASQALRDLANRLKEQGNALASTCESEDAASLQQAMQRLHATADHLSTRSQQLADYTSSSAAVLDAGIARFPTDERGWFGERFGDMGDKIDDINPFHDAPSTEEFQNALSQLNNEYLSVNSSRLPPDVSADLPQIGGDRDNPPPPPPPAGGGVPGAPGGGGGAGMPGVGGHAPPPAAVPAAPVPGVIDSHTPGVSAGAHTTVPDFDPTGSGASGGLAGVNPVAPPATPGAPPVGGPGAPGPAPVAPGGTPPGAPLAPTPGTGPLNPGGRPTIGPGSSTSPPGRPHPGGNPTPASRPPMTQPGVLGSQAAGNPGALAGRGGTAGTPGGATAGAGRAGTPGVIGAQSGTQGARGGAGAGRPAVGAGSGAGAANGVRAGGMPMGAAGRRSGRDDESRDTWLTEDEHPWRGDTDAAPAVIE